MILVWVIKFISKSVIVLDLWQYVAVLQRIGYLWLGLLVKEMVRRPKLMQGDAC